MKIMHKINNKFFFIILLFLSSIFFFSACGEKEEKKKKGEKGKIQINSFPENADIYISGKKFATTPHTLSTNQETSYILRLEKSGYETYWKQIDSKLGKTVSVKANLQALTASRLIESKPKGAKITFDERKVGETPVLISDIELGKHELKFEKPGYDPKELVFKVENERPKNIHQLMSSNIGKLKIVSKPSNASIFLDGKALSQTPFETEIERGEYEIEIKKAEYAPVKQKLIVEKEKTKTVNINLQILPGKLNVDSSPQGAAVRINGEDYGTSPIKEIQDLAPGNYQIKVSKNGFDPETKSVTVNPDRTKNVFFDLESNTGAIELVTIPSGVSVYLNDKKVGETKKEKNHNLSKVFKIGNLEPKKYKLTVTHKRANPTSRAFSVRVDKAETTRLPNIKMWIADTVVRMKNNKKMTGKLIRKTPDYILFEDNPNVRIKYSMDEIKSIIPLKKGE